MVSPSSFSFRVVDGPRKGFRSLLAIVFPVHIHSDLSPPLLLRSSCPALQPSLRSSSSLISDTPDGQPTKRSRHPSGVSQSDQPGGFTYLDKDGEPGRRKIRIEYISDKSRRHITFSKRKAGIMKKVRQVTGHQAVLLILPLGRRYLFPCAVRPLSVLTPYHSSSSFTLPLPSPP